MVSVAHALRADQDDTPARPRDLDVFRVEFYGCLTARADALFELTDAILCADGPVRSLVDLSLVAEHRRGHGAMYDALNHGQVQPERVRRTLASLPLPTMSGGRIVLAVDVSPWLRSDAATSPQRLFCHVHGRARNQSQLIPGWPYSFVAALETGRTSWTALLDAVRLGPTDDATAVTARQLRDVVARLTTAGHWHEGDPNMLIVMDSGYDVTRLAFVLADLPVEVLGRLRSDRVLRLPKPPRLPGTTGRPPKHGPEFALNTPATWPEPAHTTTTDTTRYGTATAATDVNRCWQSFLRRFDLEHTFRLLKQTLGWTVPKIRTPHAADRWTWLIIAAHTQLRLARPLAADLRRPWEKPALPGRMTPARVRRGFRNLRPHITLPASAPKPSRPGPGRPPGSKNAGPATRHDVGKTTTRDRTMNAHQRRTG